MEAVCECTMAKRQGYLTEEQFAALYGEAEGLSRMLSGLRAYLLEEK